MSESQDQQGSQPLQAAQQFTEEQIAAAAAASGVAFHFCGARRLTKLKAGPDVVKKFPEWFTTFEHLAIGDNLELKVPNPDAKTGDPPYKYLHTGNPDNSFYFKGLDPTLNEQHLSYGQINALAGDFYGTFDTITGNEDDMKNNTMPDAEARKQRFRDSWHLLAHQPKSVEETLAILKLDEKFEGIPWDEWKEKAKKEGHQPSWIFAKQMAGAIKETIAFREATLNRRYEKEYPSYLQLLLINFDHFGNDAHLAYTAGHTVALEKAIEAGHANDSNKLLLAYAINAFADHFLEDSFASGHLRCPRRQLHGGKILGVQGLNFPPMDLCSNLMHDEDGAIGLCVENKKGNKWMCYGDDYLFDDKASENLELVHKALQCSVDEIWDAYYHKAMPSVFEALELAPIPDSASVEIPNSLAPLFKLENDVLLRRDKWIYKPSSDDIHRSNWSDDNYLKPGGLFGWGAPTTWLGLYNSIWMNYPLALDKAATS